MSEVSLYQDQAMVHLAHVHHPPEVNYLPPVSRMSIPPENSSLGLQFSGGIDIIEIGGIVHFWLLVVRTQTPVSVQVPQMLHFEPSLDALSLRSDVISSIKIHSLQR